MITIIKAYYISFGCKVNLYETECIRSLLCDNGISLAKSEPEADIFVINSCTVTSSGDKKLRQTLHGIKRDYPNALTVLTGCYPQAFPDEAKLLGADITVGSKNKTDISRLIKEFTDKKERLFDIPDISASSSFEPMSVGGFEEKTRAFVKIQDGCNRFCSYCIIPKARGRICSKPIEDVKNEITALASHGYKEVVLVGINLSFYGNEYGLRLVDAIETACAVEGIERVRLGSLEPEILSDSDIKRMSEQPKLCPQFHLSLQSGCEKTLKAMNRHYSPEQYAEIVQKLRTSFDNCAITTDIMVGFPDETDEDFEESCEFVKKIAFSQAHIFPYSRRKGTVAYSMSNQVPDDIKKHRAKVMAELADNLRSEYLKSQVGKVFPVLFEREASPDFHNGHSPNYLFIKVPKKSCEKSLRNDIFYVKIERIEKDYCIGRIIE